MDKKMSFIVTVSEGRIVRIDKSGLTEQDTNILGLFWVAIEAVLLEVVTTILEEHEPQIR